MGVGWFVEPKSVFLVVATITGVCLPSFKDLEHPTRFSLARAFIFGIGVGYGLAVFYFTFTEAWVFLQDSWGDSYRCEGCLAR